MQLSELHHRLRLLAWLSNRYVRAEYKDPVIRDLNLRGYSEAVLTLSVFKTGMQKGFAPQQALFMNQLGSELCPRILALNGDGYCMEYLAPALYTVHTPQVIETILNQHVWRRTDVSVPADDVWRDELKEEVPDWALDKLCPIHGDPTLDNCLETELGELRITDPIPPQWLKRPSIRAVDHGKILQSILGWEVVLRGCPLVQFKWPKFMLEEDSARRAVFWCMIALKRIALRSKDGDKPGHWARHIAEELEKCMSSF